MSGKVPPPPISVHHGNAWVEGVTTALNWLTVLPVRGAHTIDRRTGARVMAALPVVGIFFGFSTALIIALTDYLHTSALLTACLIVLCWELLNRFMHLDGLADVCDALGSYTPPERAREILADPHTGLMGFSGAFFSILLQIAALSALLNTPIHYLICLFPALARLGGQVLARRGREPFSPQGFGALIIGTVRWWWIAFWWLGLSASGLVVAGTGNHLTLIALIPALGLMAIAVGEGLGRHCTRRFGGLNGDCAGAAIHLSTTVIAVGAAVIVGASA